MLPQFLQQGVAKTFHGASRISNKRVPTDLADDEHWALYQLGMLCVTGTSPPPTTVDPTTTTYKLSMHRVIGFPHRRTASRECEEIQSIRVFLQPAV